MRWLFFIFFFIFKMLRSMIIYFISMTLSYFFPSITQSFFFTSLFIRHGLLFSLSVIFSFFFLHTLLCMFFLRRSRLRDHIFYKYEEIYLFWEEKLSFNKANRSYYLKIISIFALFSSGALITLMFFPFYILFIYYIVIFRPPV